MDSFDRGAVFTFMLGFSMNFCVFKPAGSGKTHHILVRRNLAPGADAMAADAERRLLERDIGFWWCGPQWWQLAIALLVFSLRANPPGNGDGLAVKVLVWLGHVSFGIYLWHFQVMRALVLAMARTVEHAPR